jgi:hypothetical protein
MIPSTPPNTLPPTFRHCRRLARLDQDAETSSLHDGGGDRAETVKALP